MTLLPFGTSISIKGRAIEPFFILDISMMKKDTRQQTENDNILTHFASEKVLAKEWLLSEEDEAWKDL